MFHYLVYFSGDLSENDCIELFEKTNGEGYEKLMEPKNAFVFHTLNEDDAKELSTHDTVWNVTQCFPSDE